MLSVLLCALLAVRCAACLLGPVHRVVGSDPQAQTRALLAVKAALGGQAGGALAQWGATEDACVGPDGHPWPGLVCDGSGAGSNVISIRLNGAGLQGSLPKEIEALNFLTELDLSNNHITGTLPSSLSSLTDLEHLGLSNNRLTGTAPPWLAGLERQQYLNLAHNRMSGPLPLQLRQLTSLRYCDLSHNTFTGLLPAWGTGAQLMVLDVRSNALQGPLPDYTPLTSLVKLSVSGNQLSGTLFTTWGTSLTRLRVLDASDNALSGSIPDAYSGLSSLQQLSLARNSLSGSVPSSLAAIRSLMMLDVLDGNTGMCGSVSHDLAAVLQRAPNSPAQPTLPPCPQTGAGPAARRRAAESAEGSEEALRVAAGWMPAAGHAEGGAAGMLRRHVAGGMPLEMEVGAPSSEDGSTGAPGVQRTQQLRDPVMLAAAVGAATSMAIMGAAALTYLSFQGVWSMIGRKALARGCAPHNPHTADAAAQATAVPNAKPTTAPSTPRANIPPSPMPPLQYMHRSLSPHTSYDPQQALSARSSHNPPAAVPISHSPATGSMGGGHLGMEPGSSAGGLATSPAVDTSPRSPSALIGSELTTRPSPLTHPSARAIGTHSRRTTQQLSSPTFYSPAGRLTSNERHASPPSATGNMQPSPFAQVATAHTTTSTPNSPGVTRGGSSEASPATVRYRAPQFHNSPAEVLTAAALAISNAQLHGVDSEAFNSITSFDSHELNQELGRQRPPPVRFSRPNLDQPDDTPPTPRSIYTPTGSPRGLLPTRASIQSSDSSQDSAAARGAQAGVPHDDVQVAAEVVIQDQEQDGHSLAVRNMLLEAQRVRTAAQDASRSGAQMQGLGRAAANEPGSVDSDGRRVSFGGALAALHVQWSDTMHEGPV